MYCKYIPELSWRFCRALEQCLERLRPPWGRRGWGWGWRADGGTGTQCNTLWEIRESIIKTCVLSGFCNKGPGNTRKKKFACRPLSYTKGDKISQSAMGRKRNQTLERLFSPVECGCQSLPSKLLIVFAVHSTKTYSAALQNLFHSNKYIF